MAVGINGQVIEEMLNKFLIENPHYLLKHHESLKLINTSFFNIWQIRDTIYYRTRDCNITSGNIEEISKIINEDLNINLKILNLINLTEYPEFQEPDKYDNLLICEFIPYEIFNPLSNQEIYFDEKNRCIKNKFVYTQFLNIRNEIKSDFDFSSISFINKFIDAMTTNENDYTYIINWLAFFFQTLKNSTNTIALIGKKEVSQKIFYEEIILPIFGKEFCLDINSSVLKEANYDIDIASEKIFCNVQSLSYFTAKSQKTKDFIENIITQKNFHRQTLLTFSNANNPILKDIKQYCSLIEINPLNKVIENMGCSNEKDIYKGIGNDLFIFSRFLANYNVVEQLASLPKKIYEDKCL